MRIREFAHRFFIFSILGVVGACSGSSNAPPAHDGAVDIATSDRPATDTPIDQAPTDGAQDGAAPGTTTQKLALTIIVTDQIGGDGGLEVGPFDAAAADGGDGGLEDGGAGDVPATITVDPDLVNPWGLAFNPTGPLWVADNGTGVSTVYSATGQPVPLVVAVPVPDGGTPPSAPTGLVFDATATTFMGDKFIFSSEDGTISGWQTGMAAVLRVDNSSTSTVYKGLALASVNNVARLYATDFHNAKVDVFDQTYTKVTPAGGFTDATIPTGFAPFGIQAVGGAVWVTYAKQDDTKKVDVPGAGNGYVDVFDFDGTLDEARAVFQGRAERPVGARHRARGLRRLLQRPARRELRRRPHQRLQRGHGDAPRRGPRSGRRPFLPSTGCGRSCSATTPAARRTTGSSSRRDQRWRPTACWATSTCRSGKRDGAHRSRDVHRVGSTIDARRDGLRHSAA